MSSTDNRGREYFSLRIAANRAGDGYRLEEFYVKGLYQNQIASGELGACITSGLDVLKRTLMRGPLESWFFSREIGYLAAPEVGNTHTATISIKQSNRRPRKHNTVSDNKENIHHAQIPRIPDSIRDLDESVTLQPETETSETPVEAPQTGRRCVVLGGFVGRKRFVDMRERGSERFVPCHGYTTQTTRFGYAGAHEAGCVQCRRSIKARAECGDGYTWSRIGAPQEKYKGLHGRRRIHAARAKYAPHGGKYLPATSGPQRECGMRARRSEEK
ncbi:hypothetical protein C8R44DRAFT_733907 [Mycena epipterygia]|nr:hypothetical protein C8R44DRAFT_733907 [Mycena epipterygia]